MAPKPLDILKKGFTNLQKHVKGRKDKLEARQAQNKSISSLDERWLDNEASVIDERLVIAIFSSCLMPNLLSMPAAPYPPVPLLYGDRHGSTRHLVDAINIDGDNIRLKPKLCERSTRVHNGTASNHIEKAILSGTRSAGCAFIPKSSELLRHRLMPTWQCRKRTQRPRHDQHNESSPLHTDTGG
ncbi:hypothetical protein BDQ12DRAFT_670743 [Crucibulum laeve]|uniref:Uncharacterized protein n=1 Tax=Crucibulum laeve TaxID=68775 RepID=A0A5C3LKT6_9AGAR|nr:hypothetical protein BDQ12DRAFT_670743 [Crucibulum laeve]